MDNANCAIEQVFNLSQEVEQFPYQMPVRVLARIEEWIWQKLNEAILIRDHYVVSYIGYASYNLRMDTSYFRDRFDRVTKRKHAI